MKYYSVLILIIFVIPLKSVAQKSLLSDSLLREAEKDYPPKIKVQKRLEYIDEINSYSNDSGLVLIDDLIREYGKEGFEYGLARAKSMKSWYLMYFARYEEALRIGHEALKMQMKTSEDTQGIGLTLNRIGLANLQFGRYDDAEDYIKRALEYFIICRDTPRIDMVYNNLGVVAHEMQDMNKAIDYYKQSLALRLELEDYFWIAYSYFNIAQAYLTENQIDSAKNYMFLSAETFRNRTTTGIIPGMVKLGLAEVHSKSGNIEKAIKWAKESISDSEKRGHTEMIIEGTGFLSDLLYQKKQYKEAYEVLAEFQEMVNEFDSANNAARVAEVEEKYENAEKEIEIADLKALNLEAENRAQRLRLVTLYTILFTLIVIFVIGFIYIRRRQKQRIHRSEMDAKIAEIRLIALRSQMNPHFIFNCINTAQNFVLDARKEDAYEYLSKFASLLRVVLENAPKSFIPVEDEIEQLRLYIELESIRFGNKFSYEMIVDPALESGVIEIPAMVLQVFVENAIIHGIMNLSGKQGKLRVEMGLKGNCVYCEIEDNGVGRKVAAAIKKQKEKHYRSVAIPNIRERLNIMQQHTEMEIKLEIKDLVEEDMAMGTLVRLKLPTR